MTDRDKKIIQMYKDGFNAKQIAKEINYSEGTVFRVLRINNIPTHIKRLSLSQEDEKTICEMYQNYNSLLSIQNKFKIDYDRIISILDKNGIERKNSRAKTKNPTLIEDYFENIDTPEKAYWLGWLISDGNISNNKIEIVISQKDREILDLFAKDLNIPSRTRIKNNYSDFILGSIKMCQDLSKYSVIPNKTFSV